MQASLDKRIQGRKEKKNILTAPIVLSQDLPFSDNAWAKFFEDKKL
jgi:hypothetical protein